MGKLHANYAYHICQRSLALGKPTRRRHAHMDTRTNRGINVDLATNIQHNFTWTPPLALPSRGNDLEGLESITDEDIEAAFAEIEQRGGGGAANIDPVIEGAEIEAAKVYDFEEFEWVEKGVVPRSFKDEVQVIAPGAGAVDWDINFLLLARGVSST
jgi:hypothetical protein